MPKRRSSPTYNFETDILQYDKISQDNLDFSRAGNLLLESDQGETLDIPFVWWSYRSYYSYRYAYREEYEKFFGINSSPDDDMDELNFVKFELESDSDNLFYLALPKNLETNPFIDLDDAIIVSKTSDPTKDDNIFKRLITAEYEVNSVEEIELDFNDKVEEIELALEAKESVQSTPEPSALSGMLLLGVLLVGVMAKRAASQWRSRWKTDN